jgi:hypothetical protein
MILSKPRKAIEFIEQDEGFIKQLARDIGCYYCKANERTYNLNRYASDVRGEMGIFAWVHKEANDCYWISTRKIWVEEARAKVLTSRKKSGINCFPRDTQHAEDSVCFNINDDYHKTIMTLSLISKSH